MALYYDLDDLKMYDYNQIFIDKRYQGKGFGYKACQLILKLMEDDGKYNKVTLCFIEGNESAKRMYEELGFELTGEEDEDEIIMVKSFR